ncbi:MAG: preprotein translocase subunit YajC [Actinobacteria bacterium]|nr:MAG: preprotein translocase subunit YajC [Actinomycetota bacterium]
MPRRLRRTGDEGPAHGWYHVRLRPCPEGVARTARERGSTVGSISQDTLNIILLVVMVAAFYLIIIRPQQMRQKQHTEMVRSLAAGDRVITAGGLLGTVTEVGEDEVLLEIAPGVEVRVVKDAVNRKVEE